jgi:hypothetical protein
LVISSLAGRRKDGGLLKPRQNFAPVMQVDEVFVRQVVSGAKPGRIATAQHENDHHQCRVTQRQSAAASADINHDHQRISGHK